MLPLRWINSSPNIQASKRRSRGEKSMEWNLLNVVRWVVCCVVCEIIKLPLDIFCIESLSRFDLEWHLMFKVRVSALFGSFVVECDKSASWKHIWLFCSKLLYAAVATNIKMMIITSTLRCFCSVLLSVRQFQWFWSHFENGFQSSASLKLIENFAFLLSLCSSPFLSLFSIISSHLVFQFASPLLTVSLRQ